MEKLIDGTTCRNIRKKTFAQIDFGLQISKMNSKKSFRNTSEIENTPFCFKRNFFETDFCLLYFCVNMI